MKYLLMIYQNPATWQTLPEATKQELMSEAGDIVNELIESASGSAARGSPIRPPPRWSGSATACPR